MSVSDGPYSPCIVHTVHIYDTAQRIQCGCCDTKCPLFSFPFQRPLSPFSQGHSRCPDVRSNNNNNNNNILSGLAQRAALDFSFPGCVSLRGAGHVRDGVGECPSHPGRHRVSHPALNSDVSMHSGW